MQRKLDALKAELLGRFEVRKTAAQKRAFADWACGYARNLGYDVRVEESGRWLLTRNIVIGDPERARTLVTAHYDTCARSPFGNTFTPDCWPIIALTQLVLPVVLFLALGCATGYAMGALASRAAIPGGARELLATLACSALSMAFVGLLLFGPANPHTANDNTSGVAFVLLALHAFCGRQDVAFVLFDNEEIGLLGSSAFLKAHTALSRRALVVNMDCISDGDTLMLAMSKAAMKSVQGKKLAQALEATAPRYGRRARVGEAPKVFYPSDQLVFRRGTAFAALKGKRILYLDRIHTPKDTVFDEQNLLCLLEVIREALALPSVRRAG